ncbi:hypothetical protein ABFV99_13795 [Cytobacillus horneckiae]|uniref:hypothetical protein n=1 Tax=Cytobacillus horneckiae TaxID=549687 RepID=UPI0034CD91DD
MFKLTPNGKIKIMKPQVNPKTVVKHQIRKRLPKPLRKINAKAKLLRKLFK